MSLPAYQSEALIVLQVLLLNCPEACTQLSHSGMLVFASRMRNHIADIVVTLATSSGLCTSLASVWCLLLHLLKQQQAMGSQIEAAGAAAAAVLTKMLELNASRGNDSGSKAASGARATTGDHAPRRSSSSSDGGCAGSGDRDDEKRCVHSFDIRPTIDVAARLLKVIFRVVLHSDFGPDDLTVA